MLKFMWFETVASVMRMVFILPVLAIWLAICTMYITGYDSWLVMMNDILSDPESFQQLYAYLFGVSFLTSVFFFVPSRVQGVLVNRKLDAQKACAPYPYDDGLPQTGSSK